MKSAVDDGVHLVYQYFKVKSDFVDEKQTAIRQAEYDECLYRNLQHLHVRSVNVLLESEEDEAQLKICLARLGSCWIQSEKGQACPDNARPTHEIQRCV